MNGVAKMRATQIAVALLVAAIAAMLVAASASAKTVQVNSGDTSSKIAQRNGITLERFGDLNPQIANLAFIYEGQVVVVDVPGEGSGESAPQSAAPAQAAAASAGSIEAIIQQAAVAHGVNPGYMLSVAQCESSLNPTAVNESYFAGGGNPSGLFQYIPSTWAAFSAQAGYGGASVFNAEANANTTAWAFSQGLSSHWACA